MTRLIYVVETTDGRVKVGVTDNIVTRMRAMTSTTRAPVRLVAAFPGSYASEGEIHRVLNEPRGKRWLHDKGAEWYTQADVAAWLGSLPESKRCNLSVAYFGASQKGRPRTDLGALRDLANRFTRRSA